MAYLYFSIICFIVITIYLTIQALYDTESLIKYTYSQSKDVFDNDKEISTFEECLYNPFLLNIQIIVALITIKAYIYSYIGTVLVIPIFVFVLKLCLEPKSGNIADNEYVFLNNTIQSVNYMFEHGIIYVFSLLTIRFFIVFYTLFAITPQDIYKEQDLILHVRLVIIASIGIFLSLMISIIWTSEHRFV